MNEENTYEKTLEDAQSRWPKIPVGRTKDLTNQVVGKWTYLYRTPNPSRPKWVAKCECGNYGVVRGGAGESSQCKDCAKKVQLKDYTGMKYNKLTALGPREKRGNGKPRYYLFCQCDCGNTLWVSESNFVSGEVKSCGCLNKERYLSPVTHKFKKTYKTDLTGKTFYDLTVMNFAEAKDGAFWWNCKCKCGNFKLVKTADLTRGDVKSCGCRKKHNILPGTKFGRLTVVKEIKGRFASNGAVLYKCLCDCGNEHIVSSHNLLNGTIKSCGCGRNISYNEENIQELLTKANINFVREYPAKKLNEEYYKSKGRSLSYDFFVDNKFIIEYDGAQHFVNKNSGWNTREKVEQTHDRDLIKNKYCFDNNIPLIRIPYDAEYTEEDLKLETTRFLLTPENENEYYETRLKI